MVAVGKRLKEARTEAGLSQEKLGVLAGIDEMSASARMNQYERGKHVPDFGTISRIAKVLNVPPSYFYSVADDEAVLLVTYHRLIRPQKAKVLAFINELRG
ncbi:helix-turn-helix transcriptional regulator [Castellaniella sp.]|uniref:helix-turn-helix domain-containing protein n=1 Tax=Castellaniella sp. TaxID=1955812 RepID=UPI002AFEEFD5|nr:helix-turn-helix transcriptional regulator [Castellaniella sp.]